jgi:hypothetical protein
MQDQGLTSKLKGGIKREKVYLFMRFGCCSVLFGDFPGVSS